MKIEHLKEITSKYLKNVEIIEKNIFRGEYFYKDHPISIFYIDCSANSLTNLNLDEYQKNLIASRYYKSDAFLQWNHYLFFLRDSIQKFDKKRIEENEIYTRKFVLQPSELEQYFEFRRIKKEMRVDVTFSWKKKLRSVDLDEVYSKAAYTDALTRFIQGKIKKDVVSETEKILNDTNSLLKIKDISALKLGKHYRIFPEKREFNFKKVNLINGVNGTGKTSLLEAIELLICGHSFRHQDYEKNAEITGSYNGSQEIDKYYPEDRLKYKQRDEIWYSNPDIKGRSVSTAVGFNRFNFYNSEAAYRLANSDLVEDFTRQMTAIALGTEFNYLQERLEGFKDRLNTEKRMLEKDIEYETEQINEGKKVIKELSVETNFTQKRFDLFIQEGQKIGWKKHLPARIDSETSIVQKDINEFVINIVELKTLTEEFEQNNFKEFKKKCQELNILIEVLKNLEIDLLNCSKSIETKQLQLKDWDQRLLTLQKCKKYFENLESFNLFNSNEKKQKLEQDLRLSSQIRKNLENSSLEDFKVSKTTFLQEKKEIDAKYSQLEKDQIKINSQIADRKQNFDKLQNILSEIKSKGKEFLSLKTSSNRCPLCGEDFEENELKKRIFNLSSHDLKFSELDDLLSKSKTLSDQIKIIFKKKSQVQNLENMCLLAYGDNSYLNLNLDGLSKNILNISERLDSKKDELQKLNIFIDKMLQIKCSEKELGELIFEIDIIFGDKFTISADNEKKFKNLLSLALENTNNIKHESNVLSNRMGEIKLSIETTVKKYSSHLSYKTYQNILQKDKKKYETILERFLASQLFATIKDSDKIEEIYIRAKDFQEILKTFLDELRKEKGKSGLLKRNQTVIKEAEKVLKEKRPLLDKLKKALAVINQILTEAEKHDFLQEFIKDNAKEISYIFSKIHSPKEFFEILFEDEIKLKRIGSEKTHTLSKISSGQRSALALAIFLSLNQKLEKGPNLIIFDDPVAFTDDLNILSFLDYLRELVIRENKQIFFATANEKLASLFRKKFNFLGDTEFNEENLARTS